MNLCFIYSLIINIKKYLNIGKLGFIKKKFSKTSFELIFLINLLVFINPKDIQ